MELCELRRSQSVIEYHRSGSFRSKNNSCINWGSLRSPHTCGENRKLSVYIYICLVRAYPYIIHPAPFVHDAIFSHCMLVHVTTVAEETTLAGQKG